MSATWNWFACLPRKAKGCLNGRPDRSAPAAQTSSPSLWWMLRGGARTAISFQPSRPAHIRGGLREPSGMAADTLLDDADEALCRAKAGGRKCAAKTRMDPVSDRCPATTARRGRLLPLVVPPASCRESLRDPPAPLRGPRSPAAPGNP